jgi:hypothetical protein
MQLMGWNYMKSTTAADGQAARGLGLQSPVRRIKPWGEGPSRQFVPIFAVRRLMTER